MRVTPQDRLKDFNQTSWSKSCGRHTISRASETKTEKDEKRRVVYSREVKVFELLMMEQRETMPESRRALYETFSSVKSGNSPMERIG
jgi:hypothetical protein